MVKDVQKQNELYEFLLDFGLSEREITLYLTLLKTGPNTIMNLSRETGIKRSTTHNNVEELIKKGLVSQTNYGERRMVIAEDPDKLQFLLEQKKYKMKKMETNLPTFISSITSLIPVDKDHNKVEVKYYEGKDNVQIIYKEAFSSSELRSIVNLEATALAFPDNKNLFLDEHAKNKNLKVWEIVEDSGTTLQLAEMYGKKSNFKFKATNKILNLHNVNTLIFDNKIALISLKDNITATIIENNDYYMVMKGIFDMLWTAID
jgi:HTH-type transcriptional regulator, sugar sensing transcriptional regulator